MSDEAVDASVGGEEEFERLVGRVLPLSPSTEPLLFQKTEPFDFANPPTDPTQLALDLIATMRECRGYGLSANQLGLPYRAFVMDGVPTFAVFNPRILDVGEELSPALEEGCLSFPGLVFKIPRPMTLRVRFQTPNGQFTTKTFMGMTARCFVHEYMHLEGRVFFEGIGRLKMDHAMKGALQRGFNYSTQGLMKHALSD